MTPPPALLAYRAATWALSPLAAPYLKSRARAGKEDGARLPERFGKASAERPAGPLVWLHGASVGEAGVLLQLRTALAAERQDLRFLVTSGTRTAADLLARRLASPDLHQYAPIDTPAATARFLDHWRPDLGIFVESELWPNLLLSAAARRTKLALVNARASAKSLENWRRTPAAAKAVLDAFQVVLAADAATAAGLGALRGHAVPMTGNVKLAAPAPPVDPQALALLREAIADRPVWLAASTRAGEDEIVLAAHARIRAQAPDALLILAPRHPERGPAIASLAENAPRRALGALPGPGPVYVADTLGELGTFYTLAPIALVCGSLLPEHAGHNPAEPAKLGAAILAGPYVESFTDLYATLTQAHALIRVQTAADIADAVNSLWRDEARRRALTEAARTTVESGAAALEITLTALRPLLPETADARA